MKSETAWIAGGGTKLDFYSPFGAITTPTLPATDSQIPAADVIKVSNFELKLTVKAGAAAVTTFGYSVSSIKNPYSAI